MTTAVLNRIDVEYEQPLDTGEGAVCSTKHAWARVPPEPSQAERVALKDKIQEVQGLLRHAHLRTTALYAKVDKNRLTALASEWPAAASLGRCPR